MAAKRAAAYLPDTLKGQLYRGLERCLHAGMPATDALKTLSGDCDPNLSKRLRAAASRVGHGSSVADAAVTTGLLPPRDVLALHTGEQAGRLTQVAAQLADLYEARSRRGRKMRSKLAYPVLIFLLAVLLLPLPDFIAGRIDAGQFMLRVMTPTVLLFGAYWLYRAAVQQAERRGWSRGASQLVMALPIVGKLAKERARADMLDGVALLYGAGVPAQTVLEQAPTGVANPVMRARFQEGAIELASGRQVAESLQLSDALPSRDVYAVLSTAEAAGRLDDGLKRAAEAARQLLEERLDIIADWAPKVFYGLVVAWLAAGMLL